MENVDGYDTSPMLDAIKTAEELLAARAAKLEIQERQSAQFALLSPGKEHPVPPDGFKIADGHTAYLTLRKNTVAVSPKPDRHFLSGSGKPQTIALHWDGGMSWMYWSFPFRSKEGLTLGECCIKHGMGGWHDKEKDVRAKVVFTDTGRSGQPGRCFTLAMDRPSSGMRVRHAQNEANTDVCMVFRSAVPPKLQDTICLRELINVREGTECSTWWHM